VTRKFTGILHIVNCVSNYPPVTELATKCLNVINWPMSERHIWLWPFHCITYILIILSCLCLHCYYGVHCMCFILLQMLRIIHWK